MSTRCQIGIYRGLDNISCPKVLLYKHSDGYPEGTIPLLKRYVKKIKNIRGWDIEYLGARLIQALTNRYDRDGKRWAKESNYKYRNDMCGFGICEDLHCDIEYYYALYPDRIDVYDVLGSGSWNHMKLIKSFTYNRKKI